VTGCTAFTWQGVAGQAPPGWAHMEAAPRRLVFAEGVEPRLFLLWPGSWPGKRRLLAGVASVWGPLLPLARPLTAGDCEAEASWYVEGWRCRVGAAALLRCRHCGRRLLVCGPPPDQEGWSWPVFLSRLEDQCRRPLWSWRIADVALATPRKWRLTAFREACGVLGFDFRAGVGETVRCVRLKPASVLLRRAGGREAAARDLAGDRMRLLRASLDEVRLDRPRHRFPAVFRWSRRCRQLVVRRHRRADGLAVLQVFGSRPLAERTMETVLETFRIHPG